MSPTLMRIGKFRVVIFTRDHRPAHVHVIGPGSELKIDLWTWEIVEVRGFSMRAAHQLAGFLRPRAEEFLEAWNAIHEKDHGEKDYED